MCVRIFLNTKQWAKIGDRDGARERNTGCHSVARCELISRYSYTFSHFSRMFVYNVLSPQSICIMHGMSPWTRRISRLAGWFVVCYNDWNHKRAQLALFFSWVCVCLTPPSSSIHVFVYDFCPWRFSFCRSFFGYTLGIYGTFLSMKWVYMLKWLICCVFGANVI